MYVKDMVFTLKVLKPCGLLCLEIVVHRPHECRDSGFPLCWAFQQEECRMLNFLPVKPLNQAAFLKRFLYHLVHVMDHLARYGFCLMNMV